MDKIKKIIPRGVLVKLAQSRLLALYMRVFYKTFGRVTRPAETSKAQYRRITEEFFSRYCQGVGLDIGYGGDLLADNCRGWDVEDGDAQELPGVANGTFDFVYSSHTLEHMVEPAVALSNWWRVIKKGGYLILYLPHRDLYEKREYLPSRWNCDHKHFFLPEKGDGHDTLGLRELIEETLQDHKIIYIKECRAGHTVNDPEKHSDGEYSIEAVIWKIG